MRENNIIKSANFFGYCFILYKDKMLTLRATIKSLKRGRMRSAERAYSRFSSKTRISYLLYIPKFYFENVIKMFNFSQKSRSKDIFQNLSLEVGTFVFRRNKLIS